MYKNNNRINYLTLINVVFFTFIFFVSCRKENDTINTWIHSKMNTYYLWEEHIPSSLNGGSNLDPFSFFDQHLYHAEDHWSSLSDDYFATKDLFNGITTTSGMQFQLILYDSMKVKGIVEYVDKGSPAHLNNIKRGMIFNEIDHIELDINNYYEQLTKGGSYVITFVDSAYKHLDKISITEVAFFKENPILKDSIFEISGHKIGYFCYNSFLFSNSDSILLDETFGYFKSNNITDLVIDLRYNNGGRVSAENHLANLIAPNSSIGEVFIKDHYNDLLTESFTHYFGEEYFNTRIKETPQNINLNGQLVGLTTIKTASASEGLLNGLDPLTNLTIIGDTTHGKYTAMTVIPDQDSVWALVPIIAKSTNKLDISVKGGMVPDILLEDNPLDGYQLGDIRETMLAKALEEITGVQVERKRTLHQTQERKIIGRFKHGKELKPIPRIIGEGQHLLIND